MSTNYVLSKKMSAGDLFGGRLQKHEIREHPSPDTNEGTRCLTDGNNFLYVYIREDGLVDCLTRYAPNGAPGEILRAIAEEFDTEIFSEYEPQFWGFATEEEWDAHENERYERGRDEFYLDICAYVRGEPNDIRPGTNGEAWAKIAKTLVEKDPAWLAPENKDKLLDEVDGSKSFRDLVQSEIQ